MTIVFRGGRAEPTRGKPRLLLRSHLDSAAVPARPARDWCTYAGPYAMLGNDSWGDCVFAEAGHHLQSVSTFGRHDAVRLTVAQVLAAYSTVTGFDPHAGPPGSNPTDRGTVMQEALSYWRKTGISGHQVLAFAEVDIRNLDEVCAAIEVFGAVAVGVNFPASAMDQFDRGQPWTVVPDDGGIQGGHAVHVAGYNRVAETFTLTTWGQVIEMSWAWWRRYVDEAWVPILPEWLDVTGKTPAGLDLHGLGEDFHSLTGEGNPFPAPVPPAPPGPPPFPGSLAAAVDALAGDQQVVAWLDRHHIGPAAQVARRVKAVLTART